MVNFIVLHTVCAAALWTLSLSSKRSRRLLQSYCKTTTRREPAMLCLVLKGEKVPYETDTLGVFVCSFGSVTILRSKSGQVYQVTLRYNTGHNWFIFY